MKRRDTLKALSIGTLTATIATTEAQADVPKKSTVPALEDFKNGKSAAERAKDAETAAKVFFNPHEMQTIRVLSNYIIPADAQHGGALEAKVPEFIEFIVKDMPQHQTPMRGGLAWLDNQSLKQFGKKFIGCPKNQQTALLDQIAYPEQAKPEMSQGVSFFNLMRNLTATGYFTTEIGFKYLGYVGNRPNNWEGVPADVLKQYGVSYDS
ncbi:MAG: gluconate 2-dehydrogenase subunit 3 family protein [Spirosomaceae bacterium]|jgi:gluconate 2-dehydrogenase gamma chain|nr:gluconate 2-dehydrogenase subunit 3 family protein [Spirosomataceae bacterium]